LRGFCWRMSSLGRRCLGLAVEADLAEQIEQERAEDQQADTAILPLKRLTLPGDHSPQQLRGRSNSVADKCGGCVKFVSGVVTGGGLFENDTSAAVQSVFFKTGPRTRHQARAHAGNAARCRVVHAIDAGLRALPFRRHRLAGDRAMEQREAGMGAGQHLRPAGALQHLQYGVRDRLAAVELKRSAITAPRLRRNLQDREERRQADPGRSNARRGCARSAMTSRLSVRGPLDEDKDALDSIASEVIVHARAHHVKVISRKVGVERRWDRSRGINRICGQADAVAAKVHILIFDLGTPIAPKQPLDSATESPASSD
jgi:hypothetical protein